MKSVEVLAECELTAGLGPEELKAIVEIAQPLTRKAGERIFTRGDPSEGVFIVVSGELALTLPMVIREEPKEVTVEEKGRGAVVGWSALVAPYQRTLGARASSDVSLVCLDRTALIGVFDKHPHIHLTTFINLSKVIANRVSLLEAALMHDLQQWVSEKFA
jgi:CRP-like cAMP-binding protein